MKQKFGNWILDVAKYITTAGLIAPFLASGANWFWYVCVAVIDVSLIVLGLYLAKEDDKNKKKIRRK